MGFPEISEESLRLVFFHRSFMNLLCTMPLHYFDFDSIHAIRTGLACEKILSLRLLSVDDHWWCCQMKREGWGVLDSTVLRFSALNDHGLTGIGDKFIHSSTSPNPRSLWTRCSRHLESVFGVRFLQPHMQHTHCGFPQSQKKNHFICSVQEICR